MRKIFRSVLLLAALALVFSSSVAFGQAAHVRWDILSLTEPPPTVSAGGIASAQANDGSTITLTGSGTFVAPAGGGGTSSAATGGGTWAIGAVNGTYSVTGLVRWEEAPGTLPSPPVTDNIGAAVDARSGLAVLRIAYSDGSRGILVVSCELPGAPPTVFEGVTASKGFVDFWNRVPPPVPPGNANRTLFHVR